METQATNVDAKVTANSTETAATPRPRKALGIALACTAGICWGISGVAASALFHHNHAITPLWVSQVRMTIAGLIMILVSLTQGESVAIWRNKRDALQLVMYGLLGLIPVQLFYFNAVHAGNPSIATILQFLGPFVIAFYYILLHHQLPTRSEVIGMVLAFGGTLLIITHGHFNTLAVSGAVLFWGGLSAIGVATNTLLPRALLRKYGSFATTGWGLLVAGLSLNVFGPVWSNPVHLAAPDWLLMSVIIVIGTLLAFILFAISLKHILPTTASLLDAFEPLSATVFSIIFLGISLSGMDIVGGVLIILAVMALAMDFRAIHWFRKRS